MITSPIWCPQPGDTLDGLHPYANGLALGSCDKTGVVGDESQVDNVQKFEPLPQEIKVSGTTQFLKNFSMSVLSFAICMNVLEFRISADILLLLM